MRMPVMFMGHGSPMNAIEQNPFTETWTRLGQTLPRPNAILAVSAHWYGDDERIQSVAKPRQIYDMYGFPDALYALRYEPSGLVTLTQRVRDCLEGEVSTDDSWGIDHGTWSVLAHMYPDADLPVVQLSVNMAAEPEHLLGIGRRLAPLRDEGILLLGSGNIVHNLRRIEWNRAGGTDAAVRFDAWIKERITVGDKAAVARYADHPDAAYAVPTSDHFIPLLYVLGAAGDSDSVTVENEACLMGSLSMTSYVFGASRAERLSGHSMR